MKVFREWSTIGSFICCVKKWFTIDRNIYKLANYHDHDGGTWYWWAVRRRGGPWRVFDIRELWEELGLKVPREEWRDKLDMMGYRGDKHGTRFAAEHLSGIGITPVMKAKFDEKNAYEEDYERRQAGVSAVPHHYEGGDIPF